MGLESEIERLFHEAQDWDMEMVANSALPTYHSNYPSSPPPPGYQNASVRVAMASPSKRPAGTGKSRLGPSGDRLQLSLDKDYFQVEKLVLYRVGSQDAVKIAETRIEALRGLHGESEYLEHLDPVSAEIATPETSGGEGHEHVLEHLKSEAPNIPITIKVYDFDPTDTAKEDNAEKIVLTLQGCDYIREDRIKDAMELKRQKNLDDCTHGFAERWPERIEVKAKKSDSSGLIYIRADIALPAKTKAPKKAAPIDSRS